MLISDDIDEIAHIITKDGVVAYPTEAVFGLGCRADNDTAIKRLLEIKNRGADKGLLLIASDLKQLEAYIQPLSKDAEKKIQVSKSPPTTWIVPAKENVSSLLTGKHKSLGIRLIQHEPTKSLCKRLEQPLVSTSANTTGQPPAYSISEIEQQLITKIDAIFDAETGGYDQPSRIIDISTNSVIRK